MTRVRTVMTVMHFNADGSEVVESYEREGDVQVQEQLTSWSRECAVAFWKQMKERA